MFRGDKIIASSPTGNIHPGTTCEMKCFGCVFCILQGGTGRTEGRG